MKRSTTFVTLFAMIIAGCAVRLGGRSPLQRDIYVWRYPAGMEADTLGARLEARGSDFAMLVGYGDSAYMARAAWRAGLRTTRPGRIGNSYYAFFGPKAIGDTTHSVTVSSGGSVRLHDALFEIDKERRIDLIIARFEGVSDIRQGVRALIEYVAKDVSGHVPLVLGFEPATPQEGDSVSVLLRALLADTRECNVAASAPATQSTIRLFYGPEVRIHCDRAEVLNETAGPIRAQFTLP